MTELSDFLRDVAARPFEWGRCDCCLILADWVAVLSGADPAADLRGAYDDEIGGRRAIEAEGGLVVLFAERLSRAGLKRADVAKPGDVAVVAVGKSLFGAIACAGGWAIKSQNGVIISRAPRLVACWSL